MSDDQRFPTGEWDQIKTTLRSGTFSIELGQSTPSEKEAQRCYEEAQRENVPDLRGF